MDTVFGTVHPKKVKPKTILPIVNVPENSFFLG